MSNDSTIFYRVYEHKNTYVLEAGVNTSFAGMAWNYVSSRPNKTKLDQLAKDSGWVLYSEDALKRQQAKEALKRAKAKHCDECKHYKAVKRRDYTCAKGHSPRYYMAKNFGDVISGNWGHKRKCTDFERAT